MKKIVFLCNTINYGGSTIATVEIAYRLPLYAPEYETCILDIDGCCSHLLDACDKYGINLRIVNEGGRPRILSSKSKVKTIINKFRFIPEYLKTKKQVHEILDEIKPNFVCVSSERTLSYLSGYDNGFTTIVFFAHYWYIKKQISKNLMRLFKNTVDRFICVSNATRQALYNNEVTPLDNIYVAHNSIDQKSTMVQPAKIKDSEGKCIILHCGGFTHGKGQHISVEIAQKLKEEGFSFKLIFAGLIYRAQESHDYYNRIVQMVKDYNLTGEVEFVIGHTNVYDYMQAADILIHPSSTEGFPLVVLEAQVMKKAVVVNGVGGITDMVIDGFTGFIAEYNNVDSYVKLIKKLQEKDVYNFVTRNAYALASHSFTIESQIKSIINAL